MTKKRRRHTPEQIIRKLDEGHRQLAAGKELDEVPTPGDRGVDVALAGLPNTAG